MKSGALAMLLAALIAAGCTGTPRSPESPVIASALPLPPPAAKGGGAWHKRTGGAAIRIPLSTS